jgi:glutaredoxin-like protein
VIPLRDQDYIRQRFAQELTGRLRIDYFTQKASAIFVPGREECVACKDTQTMLEELASLTDKITLTVHELADAPEEARKLHVDKVPGIVVRGPANRPLRFFGIPGGNEFPNFVEALIEASQQKPALAIEAARHVKKVKDQVTIDVYVTPTCPYCPAVVRAAYRLALASAHVEASAIEISEFPRIAQQLGIQAVPMTVLNGRSVIAGAVDEVTLAEQVAKLAAGASATQTRAGELSEAAPPPAAPAPGGPPAAPGGSGLIIPR